MQPNILNAFADNPALMEAVKTALIEEYTLVDGMADGDRSDEQLGQMYRARIVGIQTINNVFAKIVRLYRTPEARKLGGVNEAR